MNRNIIYVIYTIKNIIHIVKHVIKIYVNFAKMNIRIIKIFHIQKLLKDLENFNDPINFYFNNLLKCLNAKMLIIIDRIKNIMKNLEIYEKLIQRNLVNYNISNINYNILQNINNNYNRETGPKLGVIDEEISNICKDNTYKEFIPRILNMYNEMNKNEIELIYNILNN